MFLVFDIGGTTTRMAVSRTGEALDEVMLFDTNHSFSDAMAQMKSVGEQLSKGERYHAVVGGVRAYDKKRGMLFNQPNFPMWVDEPLLQTMKGIWGDVYLENDAAMVGLGEAVFGAGKNNKIVAYITLSTGVGGCRITNGRVDLTTYSFEPGNMLVGAKGRDVEYFEKLVSGSAIKERYGKFPNELEDAMAWEEITEMVAIGLNNVAVMWGPEVIILGGSVPQRLDFVKVNEAVKKLCGIFPEVPIVKKDELDQKGGLYGALAYLKNLP